MGKTDLNMNRGKMVNTAEDLCRKCNNTGWEVILEDGYESVKHCDCFYQRLSNRLLKEARIPKRYENCDLKSFENHNQDQHRAQIMANNFVIEYPNVDAGLLFIGTTGVGKTHLAVGIIKELIKNKHIPCVFYDFRDLLKEIQNSYNSQSQTTELEVLQPIFQKEIVILDELGASKMTNWVQDTLAYIINQRYNDKKTTIITSNYLDEPIKKNEDSLEIRIGTRLRSRLYEMCKVVEITGDDYRKIIKHDGFMANERHKKRKNPSNK